MTVEDQGIGTKAMPTGYMPRWVVGGHLMIVADIYRRYAAECISMSQRREDVSDKALLLQMATMWLHLAEFAEKNESTDDSSPTV
jgi:hypothetical protein